MRILLVEDDDTIAEILSQTLSVAGYVVDRKREGEEAHFAGDTQDYTAVILDLGLPGMDGMSILRRWRRDGRNMPVLIITARGSWIERVEGIDAGADDYLPKPFRMEEVMARLRAIVRRSAGQSDAILNVRGLSLDTRQMRVSMDGVPIDLTRQEYRLLSYMMHHAGRVVTQTELLEQLYQEELDRDTNAIVVVIGRLRRKLNLDIIKTRRGFGYIIETASE